MVDLGVLAGTAGYAETAGALVDQYESVSFAQVHRDVLHLFPTRAGAVLDIGAGTGREAAALADPGHRVGAAEPVAEPSLTEPARWSRDPPASGRRCAYAARRARHGVVR